MMHVRTITLLVSFALLMLPISLAGEEIDASDLALQYSKATKANAGSMAEYTWKRTTKVMKKGETKLTLVDNCKFKDGKLERTSVSVELAAKDKGGLRGKKQDKEKKKMTEAAQQVGTLVQSYVAMTPGEILDFFDKAQMWEGAGNQAGTIQIKGSDVLNKGDTVTLVLDSSTSQPKTLTFTAPFGEESVECEVSYEAIEGGPLHPAKTKVVMPSEELEFAIEDSEFTKTAG